MIKKKLFRMLFFRGGTIAFTLFAISVSGQTIQRQCISSYASSMKRGEVQVAQTAGQSYFTKSTGTKVGVSQGFQQPGTFQLEEIKEEISRTLNMKVSPNPAAYSISITSDEAVEECKINVVNASGAVVMSKEISTLYHHEMNCSTWKNGIYFITISDKFNHRQTLRLLISK